MVEASSAVAPNRFMGDFNNPSILAGEVADKIRIRAR
jgi:hypothetical protein